MRIKYINIIKTIQFLVIKLNVKDFNKIKKRNLNNFITIKKINFNKIFLKKEKKFLVF